MAKQQLKLIIAGESFDVEVDSYRVIERGHEMQMGVDFEFKPEDEFRLREAMHKWHSEKSNIVIDGRDSPDDQKNQPPQYRTGEGDI